MLSVGDEFLFERTPERDDYYHLGRGTQDADGGDWPCGEAWDAVNRYIYTALQGGTIMKGWTNDDHMMIACCNDGTRPVVFKIERIDIPETPEEEEWLAKQDFSVSAEDAYTGQGDLPRRGRLMPRRSVAATAARPRLPAPKRAPGAAGPCARS